jgi:hypothetical protein
VIGHYSQSVQLWPSGLVAVMGASASTSGSLIDAGAAPADLPHGSASFQDWQSAQLTALEAALASKA